RFAHPLAAAFAGGALVNVALSYASAPSLLSFTGFTIILIASSLLFLSLPWLVGLIVVAWGSLALVTLRQPGGEAFLPTALSLLSSSAIAIVILVARRRTNLRFERIRFD